MNQIKEKMNAVRVLDATQLKLIAAGLMLLDHIHQMFVSAGAPDWLSMLGRPVFPLFLFAAAESFHYTHSKKKYLERLLIANAGMVLFTTILQTVLPNDSIVLMNNAFSTFVVAGIYMLAWDHLMDGMQNRKKGKIGKAVLLCLLPIIGAIPILFAGSLSADADLSAGLRKGLITIALMIPNLLTCEGGAAMAALGIAFYIFREHRSVQILLLVLLSAAVYFLNSGWQWMMVFAAIPMAMYNGRRGKGMKNFFYIFYPTHIGILYILATLLQG